MAFSEVRQYQPGDDVRSIDWNVSARMNDTYVKVFVEEREMTVMLLVDLSASQRFGTVRAAEERAAAEVAALLAFSAIKNNDRVGPDPVHRSGREHRAAQEGQEHVMRVVPEILSAQARAPGTDSAPRSRCWATCEAQVRRVRDQRFHRERLRARAALASARHDVIPIMLVDPRDEELPDVGLALFEDLETGELFEVDTGSRRAREAYATRIAKQRAAREQLWKRLSLDHLTIYTDRSYVRPIADLFRLRQRRVRHG